MYTIYDLILACIVGGFGGILIGLAIMAKVDMDSFDEAVSDAFDIGYEKGKEETVREYGLNEQELTE